MSATLTRPCRLGDLGVGTAERMVAHLAGFVRDWCDDFTLDDTAIGDHVDALCLVDETGAVTPLWGEMLDAPVFVSDTVGEDLACDMAANAFHPGWADLSEGLCGLGGRWLHPDWCFETDPYGLATHGGALPVGCADRNDPNGPRRYDPNVTSWGHDIGVVNFPVRACARGIDLVEEGIAPVTVGKLLAVAAVVEAGGHEALEMFQTEPGRPVWDPHSAGPLWLRTLITVAGCGKVLDVAIACPPG